MTCPRQRDSKVENLRKKKRWDSIYHPLDRSKVYATLPFMKKKKLNLRGVRLLHGSAGKIRIILPNLRHQRFSSLKLVAKTFIETRKLSGSRRTSTLWLSFPIVMRSLKSGKSAIK